MHSDFSALLRALSDAGVRFLVVGGYAVMEYTEPRYTKDLDIWLAPGEENAHAAWQALAAFGAPVAEITPHDLTQPDLVYQIGITPVRIDLMTSITGVQFEEAWQRRTERNVGGVRVAILSIEDLIANKRAVGRPHDRIDARRLRAVLDPASRVQQSPSGRVRKRSDR
jgi:predicted nucleotidyltransferase